MLLQITIFTSIHFSYLFYRFVASFYLLVFHSLSSNVTLSILQRIRLERLKAFLRLISYLFFFPGRLDCYSLTIPSDHLPFFSRTALRTSLQLQICTSLLVVYFTHLTFTVLQFLILSSPHASTSQSCPCFSNFFSYLFILPIFFHLYFIRPVFILRRILTRLFCLGLCCISLSFSILIPLNFLLHFFISFLLFHYIRSM